VNAGEGEERVEVGEPADVADLGQERGDDRWADAGIVRSRSASSSSRRRQ
jgi:hypothetical protein